ncbi:hypothetical protein E2562_012590 [Oryza meyeriana var. granulata]|uniref:Uncharacterized protein n=1 Tax=Oryza meyeriana var. granulata TaxID=110450 RepID=A0A6G1D1N5_9ORYZ|nr:hypothetical protein E2562_012590 [Oryza meyeriana var. granulata]
MPSPPMENQWWSWQNRRRQLVGVGPGQAARGLRVYTSMATESQLPMLCLLTAWMDELHRHRVAELRREVERCDLSIG